MTLLVTGIAGFIGAHTAAALLARGDRVIGIDDFNSYYPPQLKHDRLAALAPAATVHRLDFADAAALDAALSGTDITAIVHLGAQAGVRHSIDNPAAYARSNLVGHLNLLELARARGVPMVYASSSSVYGDAAAMPLSVAARVDAPVSLYAATKRADELMSEAYAHLYRIPLTGLRFFTVYGPWGRPDMAPWLFTEALFAGRPIRLFDRGTLRRDFTYVDDIVAGVLAALDRPPADDGAVKPGGSTACHALYNLGGDAPHPVSDLLAAIEAAAGRTATVEHLPRQPGDVRETAADLTESRRDLGFAPATPLSHGIDRFVDWYRGYHAL